MAKDKNQSEQVEEVSQSTTEKVEEKKLTLEERVARLEEKVFGKNSDSLKIEDMLLASLMNGGNRAPILAYAASMQKDGKDVSSLLPFLLASGDSSNKKDTCKCDKKDVETNRRIDELASAVVEKFDEIDERILALENESPEPAKKKEFSFVSASSEKNESKDERLEDLATLIKGLKEKYGVDAIIKMIGFKA